MAWACTEAVRTQGRELQLGQSLAAFMRELGMTSDSGAAAGNRTQLRKQIDSLFSCNVELIYAAPGLKRSMSSLIADEEELWSDYKAPSQDTLWQSRIRLGEHPTPAAFSVARKQCTLVSYEEYYLKRRRGLNRASAVHCAGTAQNT